MLLLSSLGLLWLLFFRRHILATIQVIIAKAITVTTIATHKPVLELFFGDGEIRLFGWVV